MSFCYIVSGNNMIVDDDIYRELLDEARAIVSDSVDWARRTVGFKAINGTVMTTQNIIFII